MAWAAAMQMGIGIVKGVAGTAATAIGQQTKSSQEVAAIKYNQSLANAASRIDQAVYDFDIDRQIEAGESFLSTQRNAIAKSGIVLNGSAIESMQASAKAIELDTFKLQFQQKVASDAAEIANMQADVAAKYTKRRANIATVGSVLTINGQGV